MVYVLLKYRISNDGWVMWIWDVDMGYGGILGLFFLGVGWR